MVYAMVRILTDIAWATKDTFRTTVRLIPWLNTILP